MSKEKEEFSELIKFTLAGFIAGLSLGWLFDKLSFQKNPIGEFIVRVLAGEGESLFEGVFAIKKKLSGEVTSLAQAYGWGKLIGMVFPWFIDRCQPLLVASVGRYDFRKKKIN